MVVATKKDIYRNTKFGESYRNFAHLPDLEAHVDEELDKRMKEIEEEVNSIADGRYDALSQFQKVCSSLACKQRDLS